MLEKPIHLLQEIDSISKIHFTHQKDVDEMMIEFSKHVLAVLKIERVSIWLYNKTEDALISISEYDLRTDLFNKDTVLTKEQFPAYFNAISTNKILIAENTFTHKSTIEFTNDYLIPFDVISLMDIPLRISGEIIGVMCYEKTGKTEKIFTEQEQAFAFSMALLLTSNLEARHRQVTQQKLEEALAEKDLLIKEINHRVKNNFSILISLLRIKKHQTNSDEVKSLMDEYEQRIFSMMKIQEMLFQSKNYTSINLSHYLRELAAEFKSSHRELVSKIELDVEESEYELPTKTAIHLGLIITEIFINSFKYAYPNTPDYKFTLKLKLTQQFIQLVIGDNGKGFDFEKNACKNSLGLPLIKDLSESLESETVFPSIGNANYKFTFSKHSL